MSGEKVRLNTEWLCDCGGCHVALVDLHDKILTFLDSVQILKCPVLTDEKGYPEADVGIVTGSVRTEHDRHAAIEMRKSCKTIIAFGTCAVFGGFHGAGLAHSSEEILEHVYQKSPTTRTNTLPDSSNTKLTNVVTPVDEVIDVDLYLPGCPPHAHFIFEALSALVTGKEIKSSEQSICGGCNRVMKKTDVSEIKDSYQGIPEDDICFLSQGYICLGSATINRCLAPCPSHGAVCTGCAGPTMQILTEPTHDIRTEISDRMSRLTKIPSDDIKKYIEKSAKTHYAYAMATKMIGNKPTFLIQKWIADSEGQ
ncbi:MAG: hypothetical protein OCC45_01645 [Desulfotalea sp.]